MRYCQDSKHIPVSFEDKKRLSFIIHYGLLVFNLIRSPPLIADSIHYGTKALSVAPTFEGFWIDATLRPSQVDKPIDIVRRLFLYQGCKFIHEDSKFSNQYRYYVKHSEILCQLHAKRRFQCNISCHRIRDDSVLNAVRYRCTR